MPTLLTDNLHGEAGAAENSVEEGQRQALRHRQKALEISPVQSSRLHNMFMLADHP